MTFTLALTGDTMITRGALVSVDNRAVQLQALLRDADVSFTNLEVVASDLQGFHSSGAFTPTLIAPAAVLDEVVAMVSTSCHSPTTTHSTWASTGCSTPCESCETEVCRVQGSASALPRRPGPCLASSSGCRCAAIMLENPAVGASRSGRTEEGHEAAAWR